VVAKAELAKSYIAQPKISFLETFILLDPDVPSGLFYKFTKEIPIPKSQTPNKHQSSMTKF